ncbi:uncharacterized protein LOC114963339 isoform X2 [Acropora millepora]|nr:uncharacterized protein LOC114963339 isoform X2 [Acropora millepora]
MVAGGNRCRNPEDIELFDPKNHNVYHCWARFDCPDGHERSVKLGSVHPIGTNVECKLCPKEMFSNSKTNHTCIKCVRCGYNKELSNCTHSQDRQCLRECVSNKYYLNATDGQCYQCSECCGSDPSNVQPHCLASSPFSIGTTVIGQQGATHCGIKASQKCGYLIVNQGTESSFNKVIIALGISCFFLCVSLGANVWCCVKRRRSSGQSFQSGIDPCCLSSALACRLDSDNMNYSAPFEEKLKVIPEDVKIDNLPHAVEEIICALDARTPCCKDWYDVGRKLEVPASRLDMVRREDHREGGRPTKALLTILGTWEDVVSLRAFVQVLGELGRNDITRKLFDYYDTGKQIVSENPV